MLIVKKNNFTDCKFIIINKKKNKCKTNSAGNFKFKEINFCIGSNESLSDLTRSVNFLNNQFDDFEK